MENPWISIHFDGIFAAIGPLGCVRRESGPDDSGLGVRVAHDHENVVVVGVPVNKALHGAPHNRAVVRKAAFVGRKSLMELDTALIPWVPPGLNVGIPPKELGIEYRSIGGGIDSIGPLGAGGGHRGVDGSLPNDP